MPASDIPALRALPSVDEALRASAAALERFGRPAVTAAVRQVLDAALMRQMIDRHAGRGAGVDTSEEQIRAISEHMVGDWCTPGNPRTCTVESMIPMVRHAMVGTY